MSPGCSFLLAVGMLPLMLTMRSVGLESFLIPTGSMEPTLRIGDRVLASKSAYGLHIPFTRIPLTTVSPPERGDVVVFFKPGSRKKDDWTSIVDFTPVFPSNDYVKRVVALPGDTVAVRGGHVVVNGKKRRTSDLGPYRYVDHRCAPMKTRRRSETLGDRDYVVLHASEELRRMPDYGPKKVPKGKVFVLGDNRDRSQDSRDLGFVPIDHIKAKVSRVGLSMPTCVTGSDVPGLRWNRVGAAVE